MIKLENIQKVFRTEEVETVALGGVSLEVKKGEFDHNCILFSFCYSFFR